MAYLKKSFSLIVVLFVVLFAAIHILYSNDWQREQGVIGNDIISYYAYLPATFIFHDIKLEKHETYEKGTFWPETTPEGSKVIKTTLGLSILYAPFFLVTHYSLKILGFEAFGYSNPYQFCLLVAALFYFLLGLFILRKILLRYFDEWITGITILAVAIGTNLFYYATREAAMSHVFNFFLFNLFIWLTIRWHDSKKLIGLLFIGLLAGFITLVRPSNIIILAFFFLFDTYSIKTLKDKLAFIFSHFHWFILMGLAFLTAWIPQFIYWKYVTGSYLFYSYTSEQFFFNNPHFIDGLFSYRKGWLVYTPIMILSLVGIPFLFSKLKEFSWAVTGFTLINLYIVFSWWCWWYGGSYGMRALIDFYGMLAIPIALLFNEAKSKKKIVFGVLIGLAFLFTSQNLFNMRKYRTGAIHWDSMTKEAYWFNFWHKYPQSGYWELLQRPDYDKARHGIDAVLPPEN
ncbi:MAG: hypothetical protein JXR61_04960 [Prolixibacteraceae bacterium]|nr:hypothetical protein [Prolixibacteraceae bacterium]